MHEISKDVPIPPVWKTSVYPFSGMEVGDSFEAGKTAKKILRVRAAASDYGKRHGKKFSVRLSDGVTRCWRVS